MIQCTITSARNFANLPFAQIRSLDCGSLRPDGFPLQQIHPRTILSTSQEMFEFVACATNEPVLFNMETKINPDFKNETRSPEDFVDAFVKVLKEVGKDRIDRVVHQNFGWRALVYSKEVMPGVEDGGTVPEGSDTGNLTTHGVGAGNWLGGVDSDTFSGSTPQERVAQAAASIKADVLSPVWNGVRKPFDGE
ncbi:BQ2448_5658 [Microbotryum intermedium]|uniref:BQ2448_5658 protein n=1 Tax=Microbotryum intermedium TaxID=269621 RepID=A0A238EYQ8_9BASI|nr:BQ2448_5658 [Microbotryum intermedium]